MVWSSCNDVTTCKAETIIRDRPISNLWPCAMKWMPSSSFSTTVSTAIAAVIAGRELRIHRRLYWKRTGYRLPLRLLWASYGVIIYLSDDCHNSLRLNRGHSLSCVVAWIASTKQRMTLITHGVPVSVMLHQHYYRQFLVHIQPSITAPGMGLTLGNFVRELVVTMNGTLDLRYRIASSTDQFCSAIAT